MKMFLMLSAASLLVAGAAQAQAPAAEPAAPAASAPSSTSFTDAELKKFANLARQVKAIMDEHQPKIAAAAADPAAKAKAETEMSGQLQVAVADNGFTVARYNEIATAMQKDPALNSRMQQLAAGQGAAPANP